MNWIMYYIWISMGLTLILAIIGLATTIFVLLHSLVLLSKEQKLATIEQLEERIEELRK